ncbi:MAG TPA: nitrilase [Bacteroidetes bacterium]|nr:nitrilase [Bacteroidota bacterium]HRR07918.1 nitrilase-related carbon-nitrogen hydrolase [Rhodothermales bacterium]
MEAYKALALQTTCHAVNALAPAAARAQILANIRRIERQIEASKRFIGRDLRLVVLPEYFASGFPMGESFALWQEKACFEIGGKEYEALSALAVQYDIYLSGNVYELDPHFPDLYFQSSFVIDPKGACILRYRRLNSMFAPTPHDVWDKYLEIYGLEGVFPVADTELGRLACIASEEILYPEIARCLMMRGAEVFLHATSEVGSPLLTQKGVAKLARAIENMAYVVSANSAGIAGIDIPFASTDGLSKIINYEGLVLCEAGYGESMVAHATIDINALRHHRQRPAMANFIARQRFELFAESYQTHSFYPPNTFETQKPDRHVFLQNIQRVIKQYMGTET